MPGEIRAPSPPYPTGVQWRSGWKAQTHESVPGLGTIRDTQTSERAENSIPLDTKKEKRREMVPMVGAFRPGVGEKMTGKTTLERQGPTTGNGEGTLNSTLMCGQQGRKIALDVGG